MNNLIEAIPMQFYKYFIGVCLSFLLIQAKAQLVLNEVQYENNTSLYDKHGSTPDWIELYNAASVPVNVKGYRISDNSRFDDYWVLPDTAVAGHGFLLIYASGKNDIIADELHANFKLGMMKDSVFLLTPSGELVDELEVRCAPADKVLARVPDGSGSWVLALPTPNRTNLDAERFSVGFEPDSLAVSHPSGIYGEAISLELKNLHRGNTVVYTLNGDEPQIGGTIYTAPLRLDDISAADNRFAGEGDGDYTPGDLISKANVLRARVFSGGCPASNEVSNTYFINKQGQFDYHVPMVSIISPRKELFSKESGIYVAGNDENYNKRGKDWERECHFEYFDANHQQVVDQNIGVRIHGRGSRSMPQKSLRLYARKKYGKSTLDYKFFEQRAYRSFTNLIISAEKTLSPVVFKDELCAQIVQDLDVDAQAWQAVLVFINGEYWGIQHLREYQNTAYFKQHNAVTTDSITVVTYDRAKGPVATEGAIHTYDALIDFVEHADLSDNGEFSKIEKMVDVDNMLDYYIAQIYFANYDFPDNNCRIWKSDQDNSRWRWIFYDSEAAMHVTESDSYFDYLAVPDAVSTVDRWAVLLMQKMLENQMFRNQFLARFQHYLNTVFSAEKILPIITDYKKNYAPLMPEHIYRWNKPSTYAKWEENINTLEQFAIQRPAYLHAKLDEVFGLPFIIYPAPVNGELQIDFFRSGENRSCEIYSMPGECLMSEKLYDTNRINIRDVLSSGLYFVRVNDGGFYYTQEIIVE